MLRAQNTVQLVDGIFKMIEKEFDNYDFEDHLELHEARMYFSNRAADMIDELRGKEMEMAEKED